MRPSQVARSLKRSEVFVFLRVESGDRPALSPLSSLSPSLSLRLSHLPRRVGRRRPVQLGQGQAARPGRRRFGRRQPLARGQAPGVGRDLGGDRGRQGGAPPQAGRPELAQQGLRPPGQAPRPVRVARVKQVEAGGQGGGVGLAQGGVLVLPVLRKKGERERERKKMMRGGGWRERDRKAPFPLLSSLLTWYRNRLPHAQVPMPMGPMVRPGASVRRRATGREEEEEDGGHRLPRLGRAGGAGGAGRAFARLAGPARPPRPRPAGASRLVDGRVAWVPGRGVGIWTGWTTRARARERERASRREWWVWREEKRERSSTQAPPTPSPCLCPW